MCTVTFHNHLAIQRTLFVLNLVLQCSVTSICYSVCRPLLIIYLFFICITELPDNVHQMSLFHLLAYTTPEITRREAK